MDFFKTIKLTIIEFRITLIVIFASSLVVATINLFVSKPTYTAQFIMAPYYEMANDLGNELKLIADGIKNEDFNFINKRLRTNLDYSSINNISFQKNDKGADFSFKHFNLILNIEISDSNSVFLSELSSELKQLCDDFIADKNKTYRGIEIWRKRIVDIESGVFDEKIKNFPTHNYYKIVDCDRQIVLNDTLINMIILSQTKAEYELGFSNNYYEDFNSSLRLKPEAFGKIELFLIICFIPLFITLILIRSFKYE